MTRRECVALGALALGAGCGRKKGTGFPGYALIATAGEKSVAVADLTSFKVVKQIGVAASPTAILTGGPDGESYVLTPETGTVHVLDADLNRGRAQRLASELAD